MKEGKSMEKAGQELAQATSNLIQDIKGKPNDTRYATHTKKALEALDNWSNAIAGWQAAQQEGEEVYRFTRQQFVRFIEWCRVNGERHRGNLQKNGIELYDQYLKETK